MLIRALRYLYKRLNIKNQRKTVNREKQRYPFLFGQPVISSRSYKYQWIELKEGRYGNHADKVAVQEHVKAG
jgi:hypothetical protein